MQDPVYYHKYMLLKYEGGK